jgi:predicted nuclease of predicted toxin-antitoxin system
LDFLVDAQLPPALAKAISDRGFDARHVFDIGLLLAPDREIFKYAFKERAAIITKDEDFVSLRKTVKRGPTVIWLRLGNTANNSLIPWFLALLPQVRAAVVDGEAVIELR